MTDELLVTARAVSAHGFGLKAPLVIEPLTGGRVNQSFRIRTVRGDFVLQRLHPVFGQDGRVVANVAAIGESLVRAGLPAPEVCRTVDGALWAEEKGIWRLMTWVSGRGVSSRNRRAGSEAARFLGLFHRALADNPPGLQPLPPAEYNREGPATASSWADLIDRFTRSPKYGRAAAWLEKGLNLTASLPRLEPATRAYLHGDPKLENFLFDHQGRAIGLIDLDTARRGGLIWELADGIRSWAAIRSASDEVTLDPEIAGAALDSYQAHGLPLAEGGSPDNARGHRFHCPRSGPALPGGLFPGIVFCLGSVQLPLPGGTEPAPRTGIPAPGFVVGGKFVFRFCLVIRGVIHNHRKY